TSVIGTRLKRKEDPRLLTGNGNFIDDIKLPGMLYASILRSSHAHARIARIDSSQAVAHPGVVAVYTGKDLAGKMKSIPTSWYIPGSNLKAKDRN
ncbi:hypothetical protein, partial [Acinetobacter baumannii]|uniref:hypothetical protein n=1 Tax=Acinetobacter baumannii TaxID=470 RepID=UPI000AFD6B3F